MPTAYNRCLQEDTALNHNSLIMALSNEVGRRLDSYSSSMPNKERVDALDKFSQKLVNSGHAVKTIRTILVGGIKGYKRKVARCPGQVQPEDVEQWSYHKNHQNNPGRRNQGVQEESS